MKDKLFQFFYFDKNENPLLSGLLIQSLLTGIFYGAFDITANSLFLEIFDTKALASAYLLSGISAIILAICGAWIKMKFRTEIAAIMNIGTVTIIVFIIWLLLYLNPSEKNVFAVLVLMLPLNLLAFAGLRTNVESLLSSENVRHIRRLTDSGFISGVIIISFLIPLMLRLGVKAEFILLTGFVSYILSSALQINMLTKNRVIPPVEIRSDTLKEILQSVRSAKYVKLTVFVFMLSVAATFFAQFSFLAASGEYFSSGNEIASFLGLITGVTMILILFIRLYGFKMLINIKGFKTCLLLTPCIIAVFALLTAITGSGFGKSEGGFIVFFILLSSTRIISLSFTATFANQSSVIIFYPVRKSLEYLQRPLIKVIFTATAVVVSGILITAIGELFIPAIVYFIWFLLLISVVWIFFTVRLHKSYREIVRSEAVPGSSQSSSANVSEYHYPQGRFFQKLMFRSYYFRIVSEKTIYDAGINSIINSSWIFDYAEKTNDLNLTGLLKSISADQSQSEAVRHKAAGIAFRLNSLTGLSQKVSMDSIMSKEEAKFFNARKLLSADRMPHTTELLRLLRDNQTELKRYAILCIGKFRIKEMLPEVCASINTRGLESEVLDVLKYFGDEASDEIIRFYLGSTGNQKTTILLLKLLGELSVPQNNSFLFERLSSSSRKIKSIAIGCLIKNGFVPNNEEKERLVQMIPEIAGQIAWCLSAQTSSDQNSDNALYRALKKETSDWFDYLINILSLLYDPAIILRIRRNIIAASVESINYAIEIFDVLIDETLKPKLIPLFFGVSDEVKINNLSQFYPVERTGFWQLADNIINRDYNYLGIWAKACAISSIRGRSCIYENDTVVALLFNQELILREEAACLLSVSGKALFQTVSARLTENNRSDLEKIFNGSMPEKGFVYEKAKFLTSCFDEIPADDIIDLAEETCYFEYNGLASLEQLINCVVWINPGNKGKENVVVLYESVNPGLSGFLIKSDCRDLYYIRYSTFENYLLAFPEHSRVIYSYIDSFEKTKIE